MEYLDQVLALPHAYLWLPGVAFFLVCGGVFWLTRPAPQFAGESGSKAEALEVSPATAPNQRNTFRRQGNPVEVHVAKPEEKDHPDTGSVLDRSMGGVRLALFQEVEVGAVISIRPVSADTIVPWVDLDVRSCRPSTEMPGRYEVGCQYVKSPPYSIQLLFG